MYPSDPWHQHPQGPYYPQQQLPPAPPQQPRLPDGRFAPRGYYPPPPPQQVRHVERQRGLGGMATGVHLILTLVTCGGWLFIWIPWWIFRMVVPRKRTTTYYYR